MKKQLKVIIVLAVVLLLIIGGIFVKNFVNNAEISNMDKNEEQNIAKSIIEKNEEQNIAKSIIEKNDYEIAKILFEDYFEENFNEKLIADASYNEEHKEFSCTYVTKTYEKDYEKDYVEISTNDFITYSYVINEHSYDEELKMNIPHTFSSEYNGISNETKNKVITLAKNKGYNTGNNLTDEEYEKILNIIFESDQKSLKNKLDSNKYTLKNNYLSGGRIYYIFTQDDNEENHIKISSAISGVKSWSVYGTTINPLYENSRKSTISDLYITDFYINIEKNLSEVENIYNAVISNM